MSTQIAVRLEPREIAALDAEVAAGRARNRSEAVRRSIAYLKRYHEYQIEAEVLKKFADTGEQLYPDLADFKPAVVWDSY